MSDDDAPPPVPVPIWPPLFGQWAEFLELEGGRNDLDETVPYAGEEDTDEEELEHGIAMAAQAQAVDMVALLAQLTAANLFCAHCLG